MDSVSKRQAATARLMEFWTLQNVTNDAHHQQNRNSTMLFQGQGKILLALTQQDHLAQKDLAQELDLTPQSTAEFVSKLEKKGFVTRDRLASDRRVIIVSLTDAGRDEATKSIQSTMPFLNVLNDGELDQLMTIFTKINTSLYQDIETDNPTWFAKMHKVIAERCLDCLNK